MKTLCKIFVPLFMLTLLFGCKKEEFAPTEYAVSSFNKVEVDGDARIIFVEEDPQFGQNTVQVVSGPETAKWVQVESSGGELSLKVEKGIRQSDGLVLRVVRSNLDEIRLTGGHEAEFVGITQPELNVVTAGHSSLTLTDLQVNHLICETKGSSEVSLSTFSETFTTNQIYSGTVVVQVDNQTLLVDNSFIVSGDSVVLVNGDWTVYGSAITSQYLMEQCDFRTVGTTNIDAVNAPAIHVNMDQEGDSQSEVWATDLLSGHGSGTSVLYYVDDNNLDISGYTLSGSAQIIPMEE